MKKILFFIPNLMHGGAEKILVNTVNNLDKNKYDVTVQVLFDVGINKKNLKENINYKYNFKKIFRGNSIIFKFFSPKFLYKLFIKEKYDIVISYLEGPTARIISGCNDKNSKKIAWIHTEMSDMNLFSKGFRSFKEAKMCYKKFDKIICVSNEVKKSVANYVGLENDITVLYNVNETDDIIKKSREKIEDIYFNKNTINICSVGRIIDVKGYDRLARVHKKLMQKGIKNNIYIIGKGSKKKDIEKYLKKNKLEETYIFIGYRENPYKYIAKSDLFICSSYREGFSTAVTEALLVGTPVMSTQCSGIQELLGYNNEYGLVVENSEEGIYEGLKKLLEDKSLLNYYKEKAIERGTLFDKNKTINEIEKILDYL